MTKIFSNSSNIYFSLVVTVSFVIVFFEVVPERSIWSIPIEPEGEHIFAVPGSGGYSIYLIQKQDEDTKQCRQRRRILIVDDELDITFTFKMILEENGFNKQIDTFNEPLLALQNFKPGVYGLLLIDIAMPVMDGFRLYQLTKQIDNKPKVLFATAYQLNYEVLRGYFPIKDETNEIEEILGDSGGRFLKKPVYNNELVARVKSELLLYDELVAAEN
ncbi:MAG: response regulator [Candidatus Nitrosopolaris sp.]